MTANRFRMTALPAKRTVLAAALAIAVSLVAVVGASADPSIDEKRAQAQAIIAEIRKIDDEVGAAAERWNGATLELDRLRDRLETTRRYLVVARTSYAAAQARASALLRQLYVDGGRVSAVEVMLGATSLGDALDRLDLSRRVADQDARIARDADELRRRVAAEKTALEAATARQAEVVAQRTAEKRAIEGRLAERERLLASVKDEIERLEEAERRRQAELRRQAQLAIERQRRLAEEQRLAEQRRIAEAARIAEARRVAEARAEQAEQEQAASPPVTTTAEDPQPAPEDTVVAAPVETPAPAPVDEPAPVEAADPGDTGGDVLAPADPVAPVYVAPDADAGRGAEVVSLAMQHLGVPYVWGGMSPSGFDCSGLVSYVYAQIGVSLPHHAATQYGYGVPVSRDDLQLGDLVFFSGLSHMGMYVGGGTFIHAPHTGDVVKISSLSDDHYARNWVGARRVL